MLHIILKSFKLSPVLFFKAFFQPSKALSLIEEIDGDDLYIYIYF